MTIPRVEFASLDPVPAEVVLEKLAEFQAQADGHESDYQESHDAAKAAKGERDKVMEKVSALVRARRAGLPVRMLTGGELTTEEPEPEKPLPLFDAKTAPETPTPQAPPDATEDPPLLIHRATGPKGEECIVKRAPDGTWWGRLDGKPCAQGLTSSSLAKREVEKVLGMMPKWSVEAPAPPDAV